MELKRSGSQSSAKGPAEYFTGNVRIDPLFQATDPSRVSAALVTFEPGARTAWHTHPLGQRLVVTVRLRLGAVPGRRQEGNPCRRRGRVSAGRETLARRDRNDRHESYRHPGGAERQSGRMDGESHRRRIFGRTDSRITGPRSYLALVLRAWSFVSLSAKPISSASGLPARCSFYLPRAHAGACRGQDSRSSPLHEPIIQTFPKRQCGAPISSDSLLEGTGFEPSVPVDKPWVLSRKILRL